MKKLRVILVLLLVIAMLSTLTACGESKMEKLVEALSNHDTANSINVGFNAKGSLDVTEQCNYFSTELASLVAEGVNTKHIWVRLQGGTLSQKTLPADWTDAMIATWATLQNTYDINLIFVVNLNDSASSQLAFYNRMTNAGLVFSAVELGNEQYLNKFRVTTAPQNPTSGVEVTMRTANMTPLKYVALCNQYIDAFGESKGPFLVQFAPRKPNLQALEVWNFGGHYYLPQDDPTADPIIDTRGNLIYDANLNPVLDANGERTYATGEVSGMVDLISTLHSQNIIGTIHLYEKNGVVVNPQLINEIKNDFETATSRTKFNMAVTEYGAEQLGNDFADSQYTQYVNNDVNLSQRILAVLETGDFLLNQLLYSNYANVPTADAFHPDCQGITPKGTAIINLFKPYWMDN